MIAIRADLLDFPDAPAWGETDASAVRFRPAHWLLIGDDGRIAGVQAGAPGLGWPREDHRGRLLLPGFVDAHVHSPQLDVIASHGTALLDWLQRYTFPAERAWADPEVAAVGSARILTSAPPSTITPASLASMVRLPCATFGKAIGLSVNHERCSAFNEMVVGAVGGKTVGSKAIVSPLCASNSA